MNATLTLSLIDPDPGLCDAWNREFAELPGVEITCGGFQQLAEFDCLVSPGNGFGLMDGGVDAAITTFFGNALQERVRAAIRREYLGEQPVGTCLLIPTDHPGHPYLAHAPTMRVPMPVATTDHAYAALWAVLTTLHRHNRESGGGPIRHLACSGLCTGTGRMPVAEAARQMALAYRHFLQPPQYPGWPEATARQAAIRAGGDWGAHLARTLHRL